MDPCSILFYSEFPFGYVNAQIVPDLVSGSPFKLACVLLTSVHNFSDTSCGAIWWYRLILYIPWSRELWFLLVKNSIWNQDWTVSDQSATKCHCIYPANSQKKNRCVKCTRNMCVCFKNINGCMLFPIPVQYHQVCPDLCQSGSFLL